MGRAEKRTEDGDRRQQKMRDSNHFEKISGEEDKNPPR